MSKLVPAETVQLWNEYKSAGTGRETDDFQPYLECYPLPGGHPRPAMVIFPGGGYGCRAPHEGVDIAERFNQLGFHAFVVQYRVAPYRYPAPQQDAFRAIKLVRANAAKWGVLVDNVATCGFSAGGHLTACTGTLFDEIDANAGDAADAQSARPDAVILCYPVISLEPWSHQGTGGNLLGEKLDAMREQLSLEKRVTAKSSPAFLWHTAADAGVPVENSLRYGQALQRCGVAWGLHVFPFGHHGLGLAPEWPEIAIWPELAAQFLRINCKFQEA